MLYAFALLGGFFQVALTAGDKLACIDSETVPPGCYTEWARSSGVTQLTEWLAATTSPAGGVFALGLAELASVDTNFAGVEGHARVAMARCFASGNLACELRARRLLAYSFTQTDRLAEAVWESEKALVLAKRFGTDAYRFDATLTLAALLTKNWLDLSRAERLLAEISPLVDQASILNQVYYGNANATVTQLLGYFDRAVLAFEQVRDSAAQLATGDKDDIWSNAEFNRLQTLVKKARSVDPEGDVPEAAAGLQALLDDPRTVAKIRLRSLELLASADRSLAVSQLTACVEDPEAWRFPSLSASCAFKLADLVAPEDPQRARALLERAELNDQEKAGRSRFRIAFLWHTESAEFALASSLNYLDAEIRRRQRQSESVRLGEVLSALNGDHYWVAARIAEAVVVGDLAEDKLGIAVGLLEAVRAWHLTTSTGTYDRSDIDHWTQALNGLRDRLTPVWRDQFAAIEAMPTGYLQPPSAPMSRQLIDLGALQRDIGPGRATMFFQWQPVVGLIGGHSWVYVITDQAIRAYPLSRRVRLNFGLATLRSGSRSEGKELDTVLANAYRWLFDEALRELPPEVQDLVVILDGPLYALPLLPLGRFDERLSRAQVYPSLAYWRSTQTPLRAPAEIRVFANPTSPDTPFDGPLRQPLPQATAEAMAIKKLFGDRVTVATGPGATETEARAALASSARVVHFASHAFVDPANPQASALVLAADAEHDGWLSLAEVSEIKIPPKIVVLSACESASGRMLSGEGLVGLASGLLGAGARTVVANLWPVDDAHAAALIERLYHYLSLGQPITQALHLAEIDLADADYPAGAWAGWTVIGDGSTQLAERPRPYWLVLLLAAVLLAIAFWQAWRLRKPPQTSV